MTMHHIATTTLTTTGQLIMGSIPSTYRHLQIRIHARSNHGVSNAALYFGFYNTSDSGTSYSYHHIQGNGSTASAVNNISMPYTYFGAIPGASANANTFATFVIDIPEYSSTVKAKTMKMIGGYDSNGSGIAIMASGMHTTTNPINAVFIDGDTGLVAGTRVSIYGINSSPTTGA
jgi:hypothetical protein